MTKEEFKNECIKALNCVNDLDGEYADGQKDTYRVIINQLERLNTYNFNWIPIKDAIPPAK